MIGRQPPLALLLLLLTAIPALATPGLLDQPQTFPWTVGLAPVALEEAGGLESNGWRFRSSALLFNTQRTLLVGSIARQYVDQEGLIVTASAAWSPAPGWELRGQAQGWSLADGVLDPALSTFHTAFGFPNQLRSSATDNQYHNDLVGAFSADTPATGLTQASLGVRAFAGPWSWTSWVKPPVGSQLGWGWTNAWGAGSGLGWGDEFPHGLFGADWTLGVTVAAVTIGPDDVFPGQTGPLTWQAGGYWTAGLPGGLRGLLQGSYTAVPRAGAGYLSQGAGLLTMGIQLPVTPAWAIELALTEEFFTWATMEVGLQVGGVWHR